MHYPRLFALSVTTLIIFFVSDVAKSGPSAGASLNNWTELKAIEPEILTRNFDVSTVVTQTPWSDGANQSYRGVYVKSYLERNGVDQSAVVQFSGANGFTTELPVSYINQHNPMLATQIQCDVALAARLHCVLGEYVPISRKIFGPVFLIWPGYREGIKGFVNDNSEWVWFLSRVRYAG